uniref:Uncharacterized protein n=1 Tax=Arundo donax TaxID=35708 RepID=A0A0A8Y6D2_ARUDO
MKFDLSFNRRSLQYFVQHFFY